MRRPVRGRTAARCGATMPLCEKYWCYLFEAQFARRQNRVPDADDKR